MTHNFNLTN